MSFDITKIDRAEALRVAYRFARDRDKAQDLVQDALAKAWQNRDKFTPGTNDRAWFYRLLRNTALNGFQKAKVAWSKLEDGSMPEWAVEGTIAGDDSTAKALLASLASLPKPMRDVMELKAREYTYDEIAEALGIPIGTVMSRIFRARAQLAKP